MLKTGKKILIAILALMLALAMFAGCGGSYTSDPLDGDISGEVKSNGGFVVEKGEYIYFINGVESYTASNKFGNVVKGSLMRISKTDLAAGNYSETDTVVPLLMVSQDYTSGVYIYGDRVYYATPTSTKNKDGEVENSYLDFKSSKLDGSSTMKDYYFRLENNATKFRYVEDEGTVYCLYVDETNKEIHSYNTKTDKDTVLVSGYSEFMFDSDDLTNPTVYYTMSVARNYGYPDTAAEKYQQVYRVNAADTEEDAYDFDLSDYVDKDTGKEMEYTNYGEIVFDGIGAIDQPGTFNVDYKEGVARESIGYTYDLVKYSNGGLYYTNSLAFASSVGGTAPLYYISDEAIDAAKEAKTWNSITANATSLNAGENDKIAVGTTQANESAIFYTDADTHYYIYASGSEIVRVEVDAAAADAKKESVKIARNLATSSGSSDDSSEGSSTSATLLYIDGDYLYFSMAGTNGNALYRVNYKGDAAKYLNNEIEDEYRATKYLNIDYASGWYKPEIVNGYLFFANAEAYAEDYVYVMPNPSVNADADGNGLKALNDKYQDVQDVLTDISAKFSDASNAAKYYFYTKDAETVTDEKGDHAAEYTEDDLAIFKAFVACEKYDNTIDASNLKDADGAWNYQSYYYNVIGKVTSKDAENISDSMTSALLLSDKADETESDGWTWQWAAIFVPVGVVVVAGVVVTIVLIRKKKSGR